MKANSKLQVEADEAFAKIEWRVQRVGWFFWTLVLIAAGIGLIGRGPLSSAEATAPNGELTVSYSRFLHYHQPATLEVELHELSETSEEVQIEVSQDFLDAIEIQRIQPEPQRREITSDGVTYSFPRANSADACKVVFQLEFQRPGKNIGRIGMAGSEPVLFNQFVYP